MMESLVHQLEEKVMVLVNELEHIRNDLRQAKLENTALKAEKNNHAKKLQTLISMIEKLDVMDIPETSPVSETTA